MALVPAICTQCGAQIEVDNTHEAGICKFCGTPFITEKAINKYTTVHNVTQNITKIIYGNEKDEAEDFFNRGVTQLKIENWVEAYKSFNKACKTAPQVAKYWLYSAVAQTQNMTSLDEICLDEDRDIYCGSTRIATAIKSFAKLANDSDFDLAQQEFGLSLCSDFKRSFVSFVVKVFLSDEYNDIYSMSYFIGHAGSDAKYQNFANDLADALIKAKIDGKKAFLMLDLFDYSGIDEEHIRAFQAISVPYPDQQGTITITKNNIGALTTLEKIKTWCGKGIEEKYIKVLDMNKIDLANVKCIYCDKDGLVDKLIYCDAKDGRHIELNVNLSILDVSAIGNKLEDHIKCFDSVRFDKYPVIVVSGKYDISKVIHLSVPAYTIVYSKDGNAVNFSSRDARRLGYLSGGVLHDVKPCRLDQETRDWLSRLFESTVKYYLSQAMKDGKVKRPGISKLKLFVKDLLS